MSVRVDLTALADHRIPAGAKGLPPDAAGLALADLAGRNVFRDAFPTPFAVLKESALAHNLALMSRYCADHGVRLAPHAKTTMAPQLFARQIEAGCWALTAATPTHVRVYRAFRVQRVLLANQLVEPAEIAWVAREMQHDNAFEFACLVDSVDGVRRLEAGLAAAGATRPVGVLVEIGHAGGRAGCRDVPTARQVAEALRHCPHLTFQGVECFEGLILEDTEEATVKTVDAYLDVVAAAADALADAAPDGTTPVVTAGGSAYFDRVVQAFAGGPWPLVLRSGCYLTYDAGLYERWSPLGRRDTGYDSLRNALEVWSVVLSRPEPGLAITSMGKRDVSHDRDLPSVLSADARVVALSDQHAHMSVPPTSPLRVGDLVGCAPSHPCTTFDKWRYLPVVDDDYTIQDVVLTYF